MPLQVLVLQETLGTQAYLAVFGHTPLSNRVWGCFMRRGIAGGIAIPF